jgi:UDP-glucose 4-epimerase
MSSLPTVLVTGARGFVGRHVARAAGAVAERVAGVGHGNRDREDAARSGLAAWIEGDVTIAALAALPVRPTLVVHCAGGSSVGASIARPADDFARTVGSTLAVLEYVRTRAPGAAVVLPSSAAVYGDAETVPTPEHAAPRPASPYGVHKKMAEELCAAYGRHFGVRSAIVRLFSVYGPGLRKQLLWDACNKLAGGDGRFGGTGGERRDFLHVEDAARLLLRAGGDASPDAPVFNGGTGVATSVRDVLQALADDLGTAGPCFSGDVRAGDPAQLVADVARTSGWGWRAERGWRDGIREYAEWFARGAR